MRPFLVFSNSREFLLITAFPGQRNVFALSRLKAQPEEEEKGKEKRGREAV